jgi:hypothetical protein
MATETEQRRKNGLSWGALGGLWIIYGLMRLGMVLVLVVYSRIATLMFGALLINVPNPYPLMSLFHLVYVAAIVLTAVAGIFSLLAGAALMAARSSARGLAITASLFSICEVPFGVTLGTYTLVRFLS